MPRFISSLMINHRANEYIQLSSRLTSELENQSENEVHMAQPDGRHDAPLSSVTTVPCLDLLKALFLTRKDSSSKFYL
ncbi:hypothetical protein PGT21_023145 [Puccinia graminis f. sp. tritici]|uniref:Uncharacterized protein n=1 Tax=Puccinia graminis f. sp. tritici TaxID=56615 RepID=A0A5B0M8B4_PUCGR|nr:hypothetical protein PGT21_023145 [Puccinia graminis f. sp. tritici]KAA1072626.1 hypothetical protein PGTUg99_001844 [Puccinia graminis f. sp. tritici]